MKPAAGNAGPSHAVSPGSTEFIEVVMRLIAVFILAGTLSTVASAGQTFNASPNPVSDAMRDLLGRDSLVADPLDHRGKPPGAVMADEEDGDR